MLCFYCVGVVFYGKLLQHLVLPYCPALLSVHCYCCFLYSGQINDDDENIHLLISSLAEKPV